MKKIFYIILLLLSFVSCETKKEHPLSPEFEEVRALMQTDPETALLKLQSLKNSESQKLSNLESQKLSNSESQKLSNSASQNLSNLEYSILLAEALYKNYLPQSNFDDVKAIVDYIETETTPNSTLLIPDYLRAKAHYYHAVGLSERNDVVESCEHYLKALEMMSEIKTLDNEQTRFLYLIYTRLGELFLNEHYCDIAIVKFRQALKYARKLNNDYSVAIILKYIGSVYQFTGEVDSALYYFNKSLNTCYNPINNLDVEKNIAQILFKKGEKDSAYILLKNNLDEIEDYAAKHSYYTLLGEFYYHDNKYDSAIYYFKEGLESHYFYTKLNATMRLSAIYDSLNDYEKKAYYDNIISQLFIKNINKDLDKTKLQDIYDKYKNHKNEKEILKDRKRIYVITSMSLVLAFIIIMLIRHKYEHTHKELINTLDSKERAISDYKVKLKRKEQKLSEIKMKAEINIDFEAYHNSAICQKILNRRPTDFTALSESELALLLEAADKNLGNLTNRLKYKYPNLKKDDFYYICLLLLNIEKNKFQYLFGKNRKTIWERLNKIKNIMNISDNDDLHIFMKKLLHKI